MAVRNEWLNDDECVIYTWFVEYWLKYRETIEKKYPNINKEISDIVKNELKKDERNNR